MDADWVPSTFDTESFDTMRVIDIPRTQLWETIPIYLRSAHAILGIFPAFLQLDIRFHRTMRALGKPAFSVAEEQMRPGIALIPSMRIDTILLRYDAIERCMHALKDTSSVPRMIAILSPNETPRSFGSSVQFEMHVLPGVVGLFQCDALRGETRAFHPTDHFDSAGYPHKTHGGATLCPCGTARTILLD